jgi:hypothetical protein
MSINALTLNLEHHVCRHNRSKDFDNFRDKTNCFKFKDGLLYYEGLLYILDVLTHFQILKVRHDFFAMGHFGFNKI